MIKKHLISKDHGGGIEVRVGGELNRWSSVSVSVRQWVRNSWMRKEMVC